MSFSVRRALSRALFCAVGLPTACLAGLLHSAPAAAQPERSLVGAETSSAIPVSPLISGLSAGTVQAGSATELERRFAGEWRRANGTLRITDLPGSSGVQVYAVAKSPNGTEFQLMGRLAPDGDGLSLYGEWEHLNGGFQGGFWRLTPAGDELVLEGFYATPQVQTFRFVRATAQDPGPPNPPPPPGPPVVEPPRPEPEPVVDAPVPQQPVPQAPAETFRPLNRLDVRLDRVVVAQGYPTHQVHAFITVKNASAVPQHFTSGFLKAVLTDADGVSWERSQPFRASGEPAELFSATPVVQPGAELKVRYVFVPGAGSRPVRLTLSEGARSAEFSVAGL